MHTDGQTFFEKVLFFLLIKNIYTCLYLSRLFLKFHPPVTKVSIPFFSILEIGTKINIFMDACPDICKKMQNSFMDKQLRSLLFEIPITTKVFGSIYVRILIYFCNEILILWDETKDLKNQISGVYGVWLGLPIFPKLLTLVSN